MLEVEGWLQMGWRGKVTIRGEGILLACKHATVHRIPPPITQPRPECLRLQNPDVCMWHYRLRGQGKEIAFYSK